MRGVSRNRSSCQAGRKKRERRGRSKRRMRETEDQSELRKHSDGAVHPPVPCSLLVGPDIFFTARSAPVKDGRPVGQAFMREPRFAKRVASHPCSCCAVVISCNEARGKRKRGQHLEKEPHASIALSPSCRGSPSPGRRRNGGRRPLGAARPRTPAARKEEPRTSDAGANAGSILRKSRFPFV